MQARKGKKRKEVEIGEEERLDGWKMRVRLERRWMVLMKEEERDWMDICCMRMCSEVDRWLLVRILQGL